MSLSRLSLYTKPKINYSEPLHRHINYVVMQSRSVLVGLILFLLSITTVEQVYAQKVVRNLPNYDKKKIHFGFTLGGNSLKFSMRHAENFLSEPTDPETKSQVLAVESSSIPGFQLGGLANFRLNNYFDARALFVLAFGQRNLTYTVRKTKKDIKEIIQKEAQVESIYAQLPLLIKLKSERIGNYRPYFIMGVNPHLDLASGSSDDRNDKAYIHLNKFDLFYEAGVGIDFYLYYFKFATELKYSFGIMDMLRDDPSVYTRNLGQLYSHMFTLSFNFE